MRVGGTLGDDVNVTNRFNPFANRALKAQTSFDECVSHADALAADADHGIYVVRHEFATVDVNASKASTEASGRRNAGAGVKE
jgi:hypothetical protein